MTELISDRAKTVTRHMVDATPSIEGVCLFGSVARGDATEESDIDLLVLTSDPELLPSKLLATLPSRLRDQHVSLLVYTVDDFEEHYRDGALFIAHVLKEGKALYDPHNILERVLGKPFKPKVDVRREINTQLGRLEPYEHTNQFEGNYLFCLSHLYSIGRGIVMLRLADKGIFEFNQDRAFDRLSRLMPNVEDEIDNVRQLRPFYALVNERAAEPLPYSYRSAAHEVEETVRSLKRLAAV